MSDIQNKYIFHMDGNDLMCNQIDGHPVDFKIGELFGSIDTEMNMPIEMEVEEVDFLNEIHQTNLITEEMLTQGKKWFEDNRDTLIEEAGEY